MKLLAQVLIVLCSASVLADDVILPSLQFKGAPLNVPFDFPVAVTLDGKYIATASKTPGRALIIEADTGTEVMQLQGGLLPIRSIRFSPDDKTLLGGDERQVYVWNLSTKSLVAVCPATNESPGTTKLMQFAIAGNGNRFVTAISRHVQGEGSKGVTFQSWDLHSGAEEWSRHIPEPSYQLAYRMSLSHDGTTLAHWSGISPSQSGSTTINFWKIVTRVGGSQQVAEQGKSLTLKEISPIQCVAFTPRGKEIIITGSQNTTAVNSNKEARAASDNSPLFAIYRADTLQEIGRWNSKMEMPMSQLVFNRDGSLMAGFDDSWNQVGIWDTRSGQSKGMAKRDPYKTTIWPKIWDIRFNPKDQVQCAIWTGQADKWIVEPRKDGGAIDFPVPTQPPTRPHIGYIASVAFSPDQKELFTYDGGTLCTWDVSNLKLLKSIRIGPPVRTFIMKRGGLMSPGAWATLIPIISADGKVLVTRGLNPHLILTKLQTNEEIKLDLDLVEKGSMQVALRVGITPDGKRVVAEWTEFLGYDQKSQKLGRVEAWETATGKRLWSRPVMQLAPEESRPFRSIDQEPPLAFSSDGKSVVIAGGILDVTTGLQQSDWSTPLPNVRNRCFDTTGKRVIDFEGNKCRFWDADTAKLLDEWALPLKSDRRLIGILPDGRTALLLVRSLEPSSVSKSEIQWIELASHQVRARFAFEHQFPIALIAVSPDGNTLVGTNKSNGLAVWELRTPPKESRLTSKQDLEQYWKKICDISAEEGWRAMLALAGDPDQTIPFVMEQLKQRPTSEQIKEWIEDLGHSDFNRRVTAGEKLSSLGKGVEGLLQHAAKSDSHERQRRAEKLLETMPDVDIRHLPEVRAVELLETIGNADAKKMLEQLAGGTRQEALTSEAQAALKRLAQKK